jgi:putative redox protein
MKARVKWIEGASFVGETGSGHAVVIDGPPDHGGRNLGPRPMEMVLIGTAACTAFDVVDILKKARQPIADCVVEAEAERAATPPQVFTHVHLRYLVAGRGLDRHQVERVKLSKDKYCSATPMIANRRDNLRSGGGGRRLTRPPEAQPASRSSRTRLEVSQRPPPRAWMRA